MKCNSSYFLVKLFGKYRNLKHPFERELAGIETFEEWEYRRSNHSWKVFSSFLSLSQVFHNKKVVDIGCGGGGKSLALLQYKPLKVIGVDINEDFIYKARRFAQKFEGHSEFICADAKNMPFDEDSVDIITMLDAFEHLDQPEQILKECWRVLKPCGKILISFPPYYHPQGAHVSDLIPWPWVHLFFSKKALARAYAELSFSREDGERRRQLKCNFDGKAWSMDYINEMTIRKAEHIIRQLDFQLKYFKLVPLRKVVAPLVRIRGFREFFTHTVALVLEKGGNSNK